MYNQHVIEIQWKRKRIERSPLNGNDTNVNQNFPCSLLFQYFDSIWFTNQVSINVVLVKYKLYFTSQTIEFSINCSIVPLKGSMPL